MATAELDIIVKLKDMASSQMKDLQSSIKDVGSQFTEMGKMAVTGLAAISGAAFVGAASSLMRIGDLASTAGTMLQGLADVSMEDVLDDAMLLQRRYGADTQATLSATRTLMTEFGLTSAEATSLITSGFANGLDSSGDFLDSIGEYSNLFADAGLSAEEAFALMRSGLSGGVLGTDKAADALKEFGIRIRELPLKSLKFTDEEGNVGEVNLFQARLESLGFTADDFTRIVEGMQAGTYSVGDAFNELLPALNGLDNQLLRNQIGVEFFGTQWEDLGGEAFRSLTTVGDSLQDMGAIAEKERTTIASLGELPALMADKAALRFLPLQNTLVGLINTVMTSEDPIRQLVDSVSELFPPFAALMPVAEMVIDVLAKLPDIWLQITDAANTVYDALKPLQSAFEPIIALISANLKPLLIGLAVVLGGTLVAGIVAIVAPIALVVAKIALLSAAIGTAITIGMEWWASVTQKYPQIEQTISGIVSSISTFFAEIAYVFDTVMNAAPDADPFAVFVAVTEDLGGPWATISEIVDGARQMFEDFYKSTQPVREALEAQPPILATLAQFWEDNSDTIMSVVNTLVQTVQALFTQIGTAVMGVMTEIQKTIATILPVVVQFWNDNGAEIISTVQSLAMKVVPLFQSIAALVGAAITAIGAITQTVLQYVQYIWTEYGDEISAIAIGAFRFIAAQVSNFMDTIQGIIDLVTSLIRGDWQGMASALQRIAQSLYNGIVKTFQLLSDVLSPIFTTIGNFATSTFTSAYNTVSTLATNMSNAISSAFTAARNSLQTGFDAVVTQISNFGTTFTDAGEDLAESFINGFKDWLNNTATWAASLATAVGQLVTRIQAGIAAIPAMGITAISSMVTNLRTWLNNTGQYASDVATAIGQFIAMISGPVASIQSMASTAVSNMITNFRTWLNNPAQYAADVASAINRFLGMVSGPIETIKGMGQAAISTMVDNLRAWLNNTANYAQSLSDALSNIVTQITTRLADLRTAGASYASALLLGLQQWIQNVLGTGAGPQLTTAINALLTHINAALSALVDGGRQLGQAVILGMARAIVGAVGAVFDAIWNVITRAAQFLPEWVRDGLNITNPTRPTPPADPPISYPLPPVYTPPPPTTSSAGSMGTSGGGATITISIGSVRDARDIDAIKRAVRDGMDEAARRGIVQSQLPRGV